MKIETPKTLDPNRIDKIMSDIAEWRGKSEAGNSETLLRQVKADDFAHGDQWDLSLKADLEAQGKYCATINVIRPQLLQLQGDMVSNPKDITVLNTRGGMKVLADVQSALLKHTLDICQGIDQEVQWFARGAQSGDGFIGWFMDYSRDPINGNLILKCMDEFDCHGDPTCTTYDLNGSPGSSADGSRYFIWDEWINQDWADKQWPDLADKFPSQPASTGGKYYSGVTQKLYAVTLKTGGERISSRSNGNVPDYAGSRYKLTHCWWVEWKKAYYWYDLRKSELDVTICVDRAEIRKAKKATQRHPRYFRLKRAMVKIVNHTLSIGDVFIENRVDEFGLTQANFAAIPVVPFHAIWDSHQHSGIVDDMIGPQETLNWLRSMVVNLLKLLPNTGWKIGKDTDNYSAVLKSQIGTAAQIVDLSKCGGLAEKIEPSPFPAGLDIISDKAKSEVRECSNIRTENPEQDSKQQSGVAILAKQQATQKGISPVFANFDRSLRILGNIGINIIRCSGVYGDDEIKAMIEESNLIDENMLHEARELVCLAIGTPFPEDPGLPSREFQYSPEQLAANPMLREGVVALEQTYVHERQVYEMQMAAIDVKAKPIATQMLIEAIREPTIGQYQCTVALSQYSITERMQRQANLAQTNELLVASGARPLGEKYILEASDLPNRDEILRERGLA